MSAELVKRLRERPYRRGAESNDEMRVRRQQERDRAAGRIEALEAENARLREELSLIAVVGYSDDAAVAAAIARQVVTRARAALAE
jgi:hypothetical protein